MCHLPYFNGKVVTVPRQAVPSGVKQHLEVVAAKGGAVDPPFGIIVALHRELVGIMGGFFVFIHFIARINASNLCVPGFLAVRSTGCGRAVGFRFGARTGERGAKGGLVWTTSRLHPKCKQPRSIQSSQRSPPASLVELSNSFGLLYRRRPGFACSR